MIKEVKRRQPNKGIWKKGREKSERIQITSTKTIKEKERTTEKKQEEGKKRENKRKHKENNVYVFITYGLINDAWCPATF
jgi:hypothetical protein